MKTKTLKITALLLILAGIFTSCEEKVEPFLNVDKTTITAPAKGGTFYISVNSSGEWTAVVEDAENNLWCTLITNDGVITVNIAENLLFETRSVRIQISMGNLSEYVFVNQEAKEFYANVVTRIEAKIENASNFSSVVGVVMLGFDRNVRKYIELARGEWRDDSFTIELPKTLAPSLLNSLIRYDGSERTTIIDPPPSTLTISSKNTNVINATFWGVDKDDNVVVRFVPINKNNRQEATFTYADSDVSISGYTERVGDHVIDWDMRLGVHGHTPWWDNIITTYSIKWKQGWNIWWYSRLACFEHIAELSEKWSTTPISKLRWYGSRSDRWLLYPREMFF